MSKISKEVFEETCNVFINTIGHYFTHLTKSPSKTGVPFLKETSTILSKDFTGMISISGSRKGQVYISGTEGLYVELLNRFIGLRNPAKEDIIDMAGELSNVIAGNLREAYGSDFMISVPIVFEGRPDTTKVEIVDTAAYVIPINWNGHEANVVMQFD